MRAKRRFSLGLGVVCLLIASGCGNRINRDPGDQTYSEYANSLRAGDHSHGDFSCPNQVNVIPNDNANADAASFEVCTNSKDIYTVELWTEDKALSRICIFPAQYYDVTNIWVKRDANGYPIVKCGSLNQGSVQLKADAFYNSVFVVEEKDKDFMQACLHAGDMGRCPQNWAFGRFKN